MIEDTELLRRYARDGSEAAFTELVNRHLRLVYSAAYRQTGCRVHLAQDVCQEVFTRMSTKAQALAGHKALVGWLYLTTRHVAIDALRKQRSHELKIQKVQAMNDASDGNEVAVPWEHLQPVLDDAVNQLSEQDRNAVLLRVFEGHSYAEVGERLLLSENAARMRVDRALEKLRILLAKRGISSSAAALGLAIADHVALAVPPGLSASIVGTALPAAAGVGAANSLLTSLIMTKLKVGIIGGIVAVATVAAIFGYTSFKKQRSIVIAQQDALRLRQSAAQVRLKTSNEGGSDYLSDLTSKVREHSKRVIETALPGEKSADGTSLDSRVAYQNLGQHTPSAAAMTFAWASDCGDYETLSKVLYFSPSGRATAEKVLARLPDETRKEFKTPELLYALLIAADALEYPPAPADGIAKAATFVLAQDRVWMGAPGKTPQTAHGHEYQLTSEGWKYVFSDQAVEGFARLLLSTPNLGTTTATATTTGSGS